VTPAERELAIEDERRRGRELRALVDLTRSLLIQQPMSRRQAEALVLRTRARALRLFPDGAATFDLVLLPRFRRVIEEFVPPDRGRVVSHRGGQGR